VLLPVVDEQEKAALSSSKRLMLTGSPDHLVDVSATLDTILEPDRVDREFRQVVTYQGPDTTGNWCMALGSGGGGFPCCDLRRRFALWLSAGRHRPVEDDEISVLLS
jgi:hypothetical protein